VRHRLLTASALALLLVVLGSWASPASAQLVIESKDGKNNLKIGFLVQGQFEAITTPDGNAIGTNVFLRRIRLMFGGKVTDKFTYFIDTDSPNLGKAAANGTKDAGTIYIQDAFVTYNHSADFKVDVGMMLLAQSHNHIQSAASLLPVDYGAYSFTESTPMGERVGRDYGVQLRGLPFKQHFEYRLGVFQGLRGADSRNPLRIAGRATWFPFAAEAGYFYTGTFQGSKRLVAVGASFDKQGAYGMYGLDFFWEEPINKGQSGVTVQVDWNRINGGTFVTALAPQHTLLIEGAGHFATGKVSVFGQYSKHTYDNPLTPGQYAYAVGVAYWIGGHNRTLKASIGRQHTDGQPNRTQFLLQLQAFYF